VNSGFSLFEAMPSHRMAREQLERRLDLPKLFAAIDADPGIVGAGVVYIDERFNVFVLREFQPICSIVPKKVILREAPRYTAPAQYAEQIKNSPRESRVVGEAVGTTLACAGAVIGWFVVLSGTVAVPFSAGASAAVTVIAYSAATASTAQCLIGGTRPVLELRDPSFNDRLDSEEWYQTTMTILDGVSLAGVGASALTTARLINMTRATTGKGTRDVLRGLSRQERRKLTDELLRLQHPTLSTQLVRLRQLAGELPKRISNTEIRQATLHQIRDSLGATLGFAGSAYSGNVKSIAVGLYEEIE